MTMCSAVQFISTYIITSKRHFRKGICRPGCVCWLIMMLLVSNWIWSVSVVMSRASCAGFRCIKRQPNWRMFRWSPCATGARWRPTILFSVCITRIYEWKKSGRNEIPKECWSATKFFLKERKTTLRLYVLFFHSHILFALYSLDSFLLLLFSFSFYCYCSNPGVFIYLLIFAFHREMMDAMGADLCWMANLCLHDLVGCWIAKCIKYVYSTGSLQTRI